MRNRGGERGVDRIKRNKNREIRREREIGREKEGARKETEKGWGKASKIQTEPETER